MRLEERVRAPELEPSDLAAHAERVRTEAGSEDEGCARFEQEEQRWAQVANAINSERVRREQEREEFSTQAEDQVGVAVDGLRALVQRFNVSLFSRESGPGILINATTAPRGIYREPRSPSFYSQRKSRNEMPCRTSWIPLRVRSKPCKTVLP